MRYYVWCDDMWRDEISDQTSLSIYRIPSRWSISCCTILALSPVKSKHWTRPCKSIYDTLIDWNLETSPWSHGNERHHSVSIAVSILWSVIIGLIITISLMLLPFGLLCLSVFHWLVAIMRILCHIWGDANHTPRYKCIRTKRLRANCLISLVIVETGVETDLKIGCCGQVIKGYNALRFDMIKTIEGIENISSTLYHY